VDLVLQFLDIKALFVWLIIYVGTHNWQFLKKMVYELWGGNIAAWMVKSMQGRKVKTLQAQEYRWRILSSIL
jgi:hypothetical protein